MAGGAFLLHLHQQGVSIAVVSDVLDVLGVAAGFSFHPELLTRPTPEVGFSGLHGFFQGRFIHPGHHQHTTIGRILNDRRDQSVTVELKVFDKLHDL